MDKVCQVMQYAKDKLEHEPTGHDFLHVQRVAHLAQKIIETDQLQVDQEIVLSSAYLHDVIDDKVVEDVESATQQLIIFLEECAFAPKQVEEIITIIQNLSFSKEIEHGKYKLSLEGQVVQDADRLEALGAIGILRTAYYGGGQGHPIYIDGLAPQKFSSKKEYRKGTTVIHHFYEKLFLLVDTMNTSAAKKEALRRKQFMENFLEEFYQEWRV